MSQVFTAGPTSATALTPGVATPPGRWDRLGIVVSLGCAVHCLAAPFLLLLLPTLGSVWSHPAAHWVLAALVLPLAGVVIWRGYRLHRKRSALVAAGLGGALLIVGLILPALPATETETRTVSASASAVLPQAFHVDPVEYIGHHTAGGSNPAAAVPGCADTCCPTIVHDVETGSLAMTIPPAGIVTLIGSVFLVLAHGINLWGCRCSASAANHATGTCGCPTQAPGAA
ncbi:MAG: MerC domain-containing protein [Planctomycetota bacterium]